MKKPLTNSSRSYSSISIEPQMEIIVFTHENHDAVLYDAVGRLKRKRDSQIQERLKKAGYDVETTEEFEKVLKEKCRIQRRGNDFVEFFAEDRCIATYYDTVATEILGNKMKITVGSGRGY